MFQIFSQVFIKNIYWVSTFDIACSGSDALLFINVAFFIFGDQVVYFKDNAPIVHLL